MRGEKSDRKSGLYKAEERCLYSGDSHDDNVVNKRRKLHYEDEQEAETPECGVKSFEEGQEEEEEKEEEIVEEERQQLGVELSGDGEQGEEVVEEEESGEEISSESPSNKLLNLPVDRLSALPDSLLIHILSFLNPREREMTSVLSKRWKFVWIECPKLVFSNKSDKTGDIQKFMAWVHRTLVVRSGNHLEEFDVCLNYKKSFASDVNACVQFALKNKVKCVGLIFDRYMLKPCKKPYMLPQMMYSSSSLTNLSLERCTMAPRRTIDWGSLTKLSLSDVELREHVIEKIISGCPVLYKLSLWKCRGLNSFEVNSESLGELLILDCEDWNGGPLLQISAPYVRTLRILLNIEGRMLKFTNISPLVKADIEFFGVASDAIAMKVLNYTEELFENLEHVKELEVGHAFIQVLSMLAVNGWWPPESQREDLVVKTSPDENCVPGIICLLESSPLLEKLDIDGRHSWDCGFHEDLFRDGIDASFLKKVYLKRELLHLQKVLFAKFANPNLAGKPMLKMVQLLLDRASVLETIGIDFGEFKFTSSEYIELTAELLCYWRSSPKAMVIIKEGDLMRDGTAPVACCPPSNS